MNICTRFCIDLNEVYVAFQHLDEAIAHTYTRTGLLLIVGDALLIVNLCEKIYLYRNFPCDHTSQLYGGSVENEACMSLLSMGLGIPLQTYSGTTYQEI